MKPYLFLAVVSGLALGSRPLVESIWDVYLLETRAETAPGSLRSVALDVRVKRWQTLILA
jgi:hypothetical protein